MATESLKGKINFPVGLTSSVMGLTGLSLVWQRLAKTDFPWLSMPAQILLYIALAVLGLMLVFYLQKWMLCKHTALDELRDPIGSCMVATVPMGFLIQAAAWSQIQPQFAWILWMIGAPLQLAYAIYMIRSWILRPHDASIVGPVWYLPIVGNLLAPLGGVSLGLEEASGLFYATGLIWWLILTPLIFYRLILVDIIPPAQMPTMMILLAPPAVLYLGYVELAGDPMELAPRIALSFGLMLSLFMLTMLGKFLQGGFSLIWWSMTFPLAAMANASLIYGQNSGSLASEITGFVFAGVASLVILFIALQTIRHLFKPGFLPRFE